MAAIPALVAPFSLSNAEAAPPPGYYLVWSDEFNEPTLDRTKWDFWHPGHRRDAVNVTNAISLDGSNLVITTYTSNKIHYTGMIATRNEFRPRFGYWEARLRWGDTNGMWSAFWLQSPEMVTRFPQRRISGSEIDIAEHRFAEESGSNIANHVQVNIHWDGYGPRSHSSGSGNVATNLAQGFHTYGFLWTPEAYSFSVDDQKVYDRGRAPISHSTEWVILSSEVDDTSTLWVSHIPPEGYGSRADSTTKLRVDYVRYYAPTNVIFWTGKKSPYWTNADNWISASAPVSECDLTFGAFVGNEKSLPATNYSVRGLVFLEARQGISIGGTNSLAIGADGIDMSAANHAAKISVPITLTASQTWDISSRAASLELSAPLSGQQPFVKTGPGSLILNATNTINSRLYVREGSLIVNGSLTAKPLVVHGRLSGTGFLDGEAVIEAGGTVSPGHPLGTLTFTRQLTLSSNSTVRIEVNKSAQTNAQIRVAGTVVLAGNLLVMNSAGDFAAGDSFKLIDADSYSGAFEKTTLPPLPPPLQWNTQRLTNGILSIVSTAQKP